MRLVTIIGLLLVACSRPADTGADEAQPSAPAGPWRLEAGGGGASLILATDDGAAEMRLICPHGASELLVNVPAFRPIGSEERLSFGQGVEAVALVADVSGDAERGGVTASGAVPDDLVDLLSGRVSASYGAQTSGPHATPPPELVSRFVDACRSPAAAQQAQVQSGGAAGNGNISECLIQQDGERIPEMALHAVGTEPFWAADVKGRCVTYSTPENIDGTRIWTEFDGSRDSGVWKGYYENQHFVMRTEPEPGCSDGMSDKRYPIAVTLTVSGEQRRGCAEPR